MKLSHKPEYSNRSKIYNISNEENIGYNSPRDDLDFQAVNTERYNQIKIERNVVKPR
jgi:hypothetical protein